MYALQAVGTLLDAGAMDNVTLKILIEGEEECGSGRLAASLGEIRDRIRADLILVTDAGMAGPDGHPTITMGLRGLVHLEFELGGPLHDLHSGAHGGVAPNPAVGMARMLASLYKPDGSVAVEGFYDGVRPAGDIERAMAATAEPGVENYIAETGVPPLAGNRGKSITERLGFLPALDINGVVSGYCGEGVKTIIPARAKAKLTARITADQSPDHCLEAITGHLKRHVPDGLVFEVSGRGVGGRGLKVRPDSAIVAEASEVLERITGLATVYKWEGASIPILADLARIAGGDMLICGFGLEEDCIHAPNESFGLDRYRTGYIYIGMILSRISARQDVPERP